MKHLPRSFNALSLEVSRPKQKQLGEKRSIKMRAGNGCQWLMPAILATQEVKIRGIEVQSWLGQIVLENLSQKTHHKRGLVEWLKV
jgi:hypothetical protein